MANSITTDEPFDDGEPFKPGDRVSVVLGSTGRFEGRVVSVDITARWLTVLCVVYGRDTPVECPYSHARLLL
jgi:transcription antitermination factor NusG